MSWLNGGVSLPNRTQVTSPVDVRRADPDDDIPAVFAVSMSVSRFHGRVLLHEFLLGGPGVEAGNGVGGT